MKHFLVYLASVSALAVAAACGLSSSEDAAAAGEAAGGGGSGAAPAGGASVDAGIDAELGNDGGTSTSAFDFREHCGSGCIPGDSEDACAEGEGGAGGAGGGSGAEASTCHLVLAEEDEVVGECTTAGLQDWTEACLAPTDCGPGLGCVESGVCRPYCCGELEACPTHTYCALRPLAVTSGQEQAGNPEIPVCVPTQDCELLNDATCTNGQTCTIVRVDGTTSCVEPGEGAAGDECPCQQGHVCAVAINQCLELCRLGYPEDCPDNHTCQGGSTGYPTGFGACVSG